MSTKMAYVVSDSNQLRTGIADMIRASRRDPTTVYVTNKDGEPITAVLSEETLTDGSTVFNIVIS